jgi:hypothetical protein
MPASFAAYAACDSQPHVAPRLKSDVKHLDVSVAVVDYATCYPSRRWVVLLTINYYLFGVVDAEEAAKDLFSSDALNDKVGAIVCYSIITIFSMPSGRAFLICPKL